MPLETSSGRSNSTRIRDAREEKEWEKKLARKIERERELGRVRNESSIQLIEANTRALIEQAKAGKEVQRELLRNYHELDSIGDASFNKSKNEIKGLKIIKNEDYTFVFIFLLRYGNQLSVA